MKKNTVVKIPDQIARLKRRIRAHFRQLGFVKATDGTLLPPGTDKQTYRSLHEHQRREGLANNSAWLKQYAEKLIPYVANGVELNVSAIRPRLIVVKSGTLESRLFRFASYYWSVPISEGYGRRIRFIVWDDHHDRLIGILALGDAVFNLRARDEHIGWDHIRRGAALVNLMDAYALGAIPPYNMLLGGKLIASLVKTRDVVDTFKAKYHESEGLISGVQKHAKLVAVTTTSSLGRSSIYNRLRLDGDLIFRSIGTTSGWGHFHISDDLFDDLRKHLRSIGDPYADAHQYGQGPNFRLRIIRRALTKLGLDSDMVRHGLTREVFFCPLANNAEQFLRGEHLRPRFGEMRTVEETGMLALERWVIPRAERLPEFRLWDRRQFLTAIESAPVTTKRRQATAR